MKHASNEIRVTTDDGTYGKKGFVTDEAQGDHRGRHEGRLRGRDRPADLDEVHLQGHRAPQDPDVRLAEHYHGRRHRHVRRLPRHGRREDKFVCVDGPEFDGHQVDSTR